MDKLEPKKVGIFGGTFDPPHIGHLRIAEEVRENLSLEKIWFIPAGYPPHKKEGSYLPFEHRFYMTMLSIKDNPFFEILDIKKNEKPSYSLKTLQKLRKKYPKTEFFFIIGWDSFQQFETWWHYQKFLEYTNIIVVSREKIPFEEAVKIVKERSNYLWGKKYTNKVIFLKTISLDISSTFIRNLCRLGKSIRYLVTEEVYSYIQKERLYQR